MALTLLQESRFQTSYRKYHCWFIEIPNAIALPVGRIWVYQVRNRARQTGQRSSFPIGGHRRSRLAEMEHALRGWIADEPGLTLAELQERLAQPVKDIEKLVFIDETWASTCMTRRYERAPKGNQLADAQPPKL